MTKVNNKKILLIDSYFGGSHKYWAEQLQEFSSYQIHIEYLKPRHWKWRMHGGAISLFNQIQKISQYSIIIATDMVDLALFRSLNKDNAQIPHCIYFHENQMAYPDSDDIKYHFINYSSALVADKVFFNSQFNFDSFINGCKKLLKIFPDYRNLETIEEIRNKSIVLPIGINFKKMNSHKSIECNEEPHILWNHRWDYDKNPSAFFKTLIQLKKEKINFRLILLGKRSDKTQNQFTDELDLLKDNIVINKSIKDYEEYLKWVWKSDIIPVTSNHDFFGISIIEAIYCQTHPLLPDRLVYPEHIPKDYRDKYLYQDNFYSKLKTLLENWNSPVPKEVIQHIKKYDWSELIQRYDTAFKSLL